MRCRVREWGEGVFAGVGISMGTAPTRANTARSDTHYFQLYETMVYVRVYEVQIECTFYMSHVKLNSPPLHRREEEIYIKFQGL